MSTVVELLSQQGEARAHFRASNGDWVDSFFDRVVEEIIAVRAVDTPLQDLTLKYGAANANVVLTSNGRTQLNVRWSKGRGWSCYTADSYEMAVAQLWTELAMVEQLKEERNA